MRTESPLMPILNTWLPAVMSGDTTHKARLLEAIRTLPTSDAQGELLAHLKTQYPDEAALQSGDVDVLLFLAQWAERLVQGTANTTTAEVRQANWQWALQALKVAAEDRRHPPALYLSASKFGAGIPDVLEKDLEKSLQHLREAAELGFAMAQHDMGQNYQRGAGALLPKDPNAALDYFRRAAAQDFGPSQEALAAHAFNQQKDYAAGFEWLKKSADNNYGSAAYQCAQLYAKGFQQGDFALPKDAQQAMLYLKKAADAGHIQAQYDYANNIKNQTDPSEYLRYLTSAAIQNHPQAKVDIQRVSPEQCSRVIVSQGNQLKRQARTIQALQQHIQLLTHCIGSLSTQLQARLGDDFKLSALLPAGVTVLGGPAETDSDSEEEFQDAVAEQDVTVH